MTLSTGSSQEFNRNLHVRRSDLDQRMLSGKVIESVAGKKMTLIGHCLPECDQLDTFGLLQHPPAA